MDSISSGFILCKPSPTSDCASPAKPSLALFAAPAGLLFIGTPFTIIKGELLPPKEDCPLLRIFEDPPGPVGGAATFNPATFPCKLLPTLVVLEAVNWSVFTLVVA